MLPKDTKRRKLEAKADGQTQLDSHLRERETKEHIVPYSDALFQEAAIEWLVETDQVSYVACSDHGITSLLTCFLFQPLDALNHPAFKQMVHLAARATNGVKIPSRKQTRQVIIDTFKTNIRKLRQRLSVRLILSLRLFFTHSVRATPAKDV
jgi:hypothetical protein